MKIYLILLSLLGFCTAHSQIVGSQVWDLDSPGLSSTSSIMDKMGEAISRGDYNGDGWQDLAIGIPQFDWELFANIPNVGTVLILYGSPNGISTDESQLLFQTFETDPPNVENLNGMEANDLFGQSLASGDFNCDGITDLAVGTPEEDVTLTGDVPRANVGAVNIFYGSDTGFTDGGQGSTFLLQGTGQGVFFSDNIEAGDRFGWSMATGNFNGDFESGNSCHDLAVSAPFEDFGDVSPISNGGIVHIYYGSSSGISGDNRDTLSQNTFNADGVIESNDQFGRSLAAGKFRGASDFLGLSFSDLAVGIPGEEVDGENNAGAVQVFNGGSAGLQSRLSSANDDFIWSQSGAIIGVVETGDRFGSTLVTGDFNSDQFTDLVVGVPQEDLNVDGIYDAGAVNVIYGGPSGLSTLNNQLFTQDLNGIGGFPENADQFGDSLISGDLNYDLYPDLVVGVPRENSLRGAFHVIHGGPNGLTAADSIYHINIGGDEMDEMSFSMVIGDFGNGSELAVGIPGDDSSDGDNDSGSVQIFEFENPDVIFPDVIFENSFE